jgi:diguanylate cyclase (GGDEF)-like protein
MRHSFQGLRFSIAAKLYLQVALSVGLVTALAGGAIFLSRQAEWVAHALYEDGFLQLQDALSLDKLLEQHRRLVGSAPAELERERLRETEQTLVVVEAKLAAALSENGSATAGSNDVLRKRIVAILPSFLEASRQVLLFAKNFAQDKALEAANGPYSKAADQIEKLMSARHAEQVVKAKASFEGLQETGKSLVQWSVVNALLALALLGLGAVLMRSGVLFPLRRITAVMRQLASNDTMVVVPFQSARDEIGDMARALEIFKSNAVDLLTRKEELEHANVHFQAALTNMSQGLCLFDANHRLIVCNDRYVRMYGIPPELRVAGTPFRAILEHRVKTGSSDGADPKQFDGRQVIEFSRRAVTRDLADGRSISIWHEQMADGGWVMTHEDITERRRTDAQIARMAHHDALTDLPNRNLLRERLDDAIAESNTSGKNFALLCLDLDRFKAVNDNLGHPSGDALLQDVAQRLRECVGDAGTVARLGGDEFAILYTARDQPEAAADLADRIVDAINRPYDLNGDCVNVGTSIGVALFPNDGADAEALFRNADLALYKAKADGGNVWRFFKEEMGEKVQARRHFEADLRNALPNGELELFYQPIVSLVSGEVAGLEALLRWRHPQRGLVSPAEFIPLAEEIGAIGAIGDWVIRQACIEAARWPKNIYVAVNLSPKQFNGPRTLGPIVAMALADSGLRPGRLELEITESVVLEDNAETLAVLYELRALGIRVSLDDFGTGYSSLSYLRKFPFDKIKVDQSFVREMTTRDDCSAIVFAVTALAKALRMTTTAEGVETIEQFEQLRIAGCTEVQGYLFSKPKPASEVAEMLKCCTGAIHRAA